MTRMCRCCRQPIYQVVTGGVWFHAKDGSIWCPGGKMTAVAPSDIGGSDG